MQIEAAEVGCQIEADPGERLAGCDRGQVRDLLRAHGWVMFSGFNPSVADFEVFAGGFGVCQDTRAVHYPPGGAALGFHAEDAYNPFRPDAIWFFCIAEGTGGGVPTLVVDGVEIFAGLGDRWQEFSRSHHLLFERQWNADTWREVVSPGERRDLEALLDRIPSLSFRFLSDGTLYVSYVAPIVVTTPAGDESFSNTFLSAVTEPDFYGMSLSDGSGIPDDYVALVQELARKGERSVGWKAGQIIVIDNARMMHRRGEYHGSGRDLRVRHGEDLFGSVLPDMRSPLGVWAKRLLQGDGAQTVRVGPVVADLDRDEPSGW